MKKKVKGASRYAYIGPTIVGVVQNGTIFKSVPDLPQKLMPLVIADDQLADALIEVKKPNTYLHKAYIAVGK